VWAEIMRVRSVRGHVRRARRRVASAAAACDEDRVTDLVERASSTEGATRAPGATYARAPQRLSALRALLPFFRPYRGRLVAAACFLVLASASTLAFPWALRALIDRGLVAPDPGARVMAVRGHFALLFAVAVAFALFTAARVYMVTWIGERVTADLRSAVYAHVLRQSPSFFETAQAGELLSRLSTDTTLVQTVAGGSLSMGLRSALVATGALVMLVVTTPYVMTQVIVLVLLIVLPSMLLGRRLRKLSRDSQDRVADTSALAGEVLGAVKVVQSYTREAWEARRYDEAVERAFRTATRRSRLRAQLMVFVMGATFAGLLYSLYQGTEAVLHGALSAGQLGQTVVYAMILVSSVATLADVYGDLLRAAGATERLMELLATEPAIRAPAQPVALVPSERGASVSLERVTFHYPSRPDHAALTDFSLALAPGETVALVGPSGAGKSTVMQLLLRFYDVHAGRITLDGVPVAALAPDALRASIALVPQDSVMFSTSARENIRYGRLDARDDEVVAAAQAAHAHAFVERLPEGYDTFLGERGVRLSGGQRQRISIARALLKNAPLLLLDEATSALDAESERMVRAALATAMRGRTTLVIAHRLSTVQRADRIVVMEDGRVVDTGTHEQLIARGGLYARLVALELEGS